MTAEPDLLPLPPPVRMSSDQAYLGFTIDQMQAYARANVAHATAAKDAEVEALRAEVAEWKRVASAQAELHGEAEDRAALLAEALRECRPFVAYAFDQGIVGADVAGLALDAALDQEAGRG